MPGPRFTEAISAAATPRRYQLRSRSTIRRLRVQPRAAAADDVLISATRPPKQLRLRRPDRCRVCSADLPVGNTAIWDPAARTVTCLSCAGSELAAGPIDSGQPGASARREYQRRHYAREQRARDKLGGVGALLAKLTDEPSSTRVWQQGGNGEVRVGDRLENCSTPPACGCSMTAEWPPTVRRTSTTSPLDPEASPSSTPRPATGGSGATGKTDSSQSDERSSALTAATRPS